MTLNLRKRNAWSIFVIQPARRRQITHQISMRRFHTSKLLRVILLLSVAPVYGDSLINGNWQHCDKPAWINFNFVGKVGNATVTRHEENRDAEGLTLLKQLQFVDDDGLGLMYDAANDEFVEVNLKIVDQSTVHIYLRSRAGEPILSITRQRASKSNVENSADCVHASSPKEKYE